MLAVLKRPFGSPNAVIYSYEVSKRFLSPNASSVLEVGCGVGIFALRYAAQRKNTFVMGVDQSEKTIEYLANNYERYYKNLKLVACDFCQKDLYLGREFDEVYSSDVLEHVTEVQPFVHNIHRHLRVGGRVVVNFPNEMNHGINHFQEVGDVLGLFAAFREVKVFAVDIQHPVNRLWFAMRALYEGLFSRSTRDARKHLYSEREEQGIDQFDESTCFTFVNESGKLRNAMACLLAEIFLLVKPSIVVRRLDTGSIVNAPRLVATAIK